MQEAEPSSSLIVTISDQPSMPNAARPARKRLNEMYERLGKGTNEVQQTVVVSAYLSRAGPDQHDGYRAVKTRETLLAGRCGYGLSVDHFHASRDEFRVRNACRGRWRAELYGATAQKRDACAFAQCCSCVSLAQRKRPSAALAMYGKPQSHTHLWTLVRRIVRLAVRLDDRT